MLSLKESSLLAGGVQVEVSKQKGILIVKNRIRTIFFIGLIIALFCVNSYASDAVPTKNVWTYASPGVEASKIYAQKTDSGWYLFVPASAGDSIDIYAKGEEPQAVTLITDKTVITAAGLDITVVKGSYISSAFLVSEDPVKQGRKWVESSIKKTNKAKGNMLMLSAAGDEIYNGGLSQIKGRGNSTWGHIKKPYQIKLEEKTDLIARADAGSYLVSGNYGDNTSKTWCLIANFLDDSLIRNLITYDFGVELGLMETPGYICTDLYYDGEYRGVYLLTEKVEVGNGRVEIEDLDKANEAANPNYDYSKYNVEYGTTSFGTKCKWVKGVNNPADITGGYLIEFESDERIDSETNWWITKNGYHIYTRSPEFASKEELLYVADLYQQFEDAVMAGGINPATGKSFSEYVDLDSLVRTYLILELAGCGEAYYNSTFMYLDAGSNMFYAGPIWDFDLSYPQMFYAESLRAGNGKLGSSLLGIHEFRIAAKKIWFEEFVPLLNSYTAPSGKIDQIASILQASADNNYKLWPYTSWYEVPYGGYTLKENTDYVKEYISKSVNYLYNIYNVSKIGFIDVVDTDWYSDYVAYVKEKGYMDGLNSVFFKPSDKLTRAMLITVLYRVSGEDSEYIPIFEDVPENTYYSKACTWGFDSGIAQGSNGMFMGSSNATRQDAVTMLYRAFGNGEISDSAPFTDYVSISDYAIDAVNWAFEKGIVSGYNDGTFRPGDYVSRAEFSKMITLLTRK